MNTDLDDLLAAEARAVEIAEARNDPNAALPARSKVTRGHPRAKNLQVRLHDDEFQRVAELAAERGLPMSTMVRALILREIAPADDLRSAFDRLEADLSTIRRTALRS